MKAIKTWIVLAIFGLATTSSFSHVLTIEKNPIIKILQNQDREEIAVSDVPANVTKVVEADYPNHTIAKAFKSTVNEKTTYHLVLSNGTDNVEVSFDADGNKL